MPAEIRIRSATPQDRLPVLRMLELYQHDLSDIWDQDLDPHGEFGYELDRFWSRPDCWPYVFLVDAKFAGFALVDTRVRVEGDEFWMDQFFVMKKYRRQGVGQAGAVFVLAQHPGRWQVGQMPQNRSARSFWRQVIDEFTGGQFVEEEVGSGWWKGFVQRFSSLGRTIDA